MANQSGADRAAVEWPQECLVRELCRAGLGLQIRGERIYIMAAPSFWASWQNIASQTGIRIPREVPKNYGARDWKLENAESLGRELDLWGSGSCFWYCASCSSPIRLSRFSFQPEWRSQASTPSPEKMKAHFCSSPTVLPFPKDSKKFGFE